MSFRRTIIVLVAACGTLAMAAHVRAQLGPITAPVALNTNADSDERDDFRPQVTTDGAGNWVAVWQSTENLGGTIGNDGDILVSLVLFFSRAWARPAGYLRQRGRLFRVSPSTRFCCVVVRREGRFQRPS